MNFKRNYVILCPGKFLSKEGEVEAMFLPELGHFLKQTAHKADWFYSLNELGILTQLVFPHQSSV